MDRQGWASVAGDASDTWRHIQALVEAAPMPAVGVGVTSGTRLLYSHVHGMADLTCDEPVTRKHYWDLASLTKTLVLLPEVLALVDAGHLVLDAPLADQWPEAGDKPVGEATLAQVLQYDAGLPSWRPYYKETGLSPSDQRDLILSTRLERAPGSGPVYSDMGALQLGFLVEALTGRSISVLAASRSGLSFGPGLSPVVATEDCAWRGRLLKGEVHDENAAALGGAAGHAGAFGTLAEVLAQVRAWLSGSVVSKRLHSECTLRAAQNAMGERYGLGWWLRNTRGIGGTEPGRDSWGASGFVGNRLWFEPRRDYAVVILSNRVHPRRGDRTDFDQWCREVLDAVAISRLANVELSRRRP